MPKTPKQVSSTSWYILFVNCEPKRKYATTSSIVITMTVRGMQFEPDEEDKIMGALTYPGTSRLILDIVSINRISYN